jgi:CheY-like chemotaxis protein
MNKPIIMTIDDEPHVLNAVARDLQAHYKNDYRIVKASSGAEALEAVQEFKRRDAPLALLIADQRMPAMSGVEFLAKPSSSIRNRNGCCSPPTRIPTPPSPASTPSVSTTT